MVTQRMTGSFFFHDIQCFHVPYSVYSSPSWIFMVLVFWSRLWHAGWGSSPRTIGCYPEADQEISRTVASGSSENTSSTLAKCCVCSLFIAIWRGSEWLLLVVMSQWCLCFVCPCATYLPRRWKSFRREPPSCPRAAGKPWLLRDLGQMLPRKRQKRRNLADFCADPGRKWPWYAKEAIQIDTFDTVSWNGPTYLWVCQTCWIEINTNIHAHSSLGKCLSRVFFQRKKAYVSLTLGPEDGCAFLCHLAELIQFVLDEGFFTQGCRSRSCCLRFWLLGTY